MNSRKKMCTLINEVVIMNKKITNIIIIIFSRSLTELLVQWEDTIDCRMAKNIIFVQDSQTKKQSWPRQCRSTGQSLRAVIPTCRGSIRACDKCNLCSSIIIIFTNHALCIYVCTTLMHHHTTFHKVWHPHVYYYQCTALAVTSFLWYLPFMCFSRQCVECGMSGLNINLW